MRPEKEPSYLKAKIKLGTIFTEKNIFESTWVEVRLKLVQIWILKKCRDGDKTGIVFLLYISGPMDYGN